MNRPLCCLSGLCLLLALSSPALTDRLPVSSPNDLRTELGVSISSIALGTSDKREFTITIPKDSIRRKGVQDVIFIVCTDGDMEKVQARIPVALSEMTDAGRSARFSVSQVYMRDAFVEVTYCPGPKAPLMFLSARLADFTRIDEQKTRSQQPVRGDGEPAPQP